MKVDLDKLRELAHEGQINEERRRQQAEIEKQRASKEAEENRALSLIKEAQEIIAKIPRRVETAARQGKQWLEVIEFEAWLDQHNKDIYRNRLKWLWLNPTIILKPHTKMIYDWCKSTGFRTSICPSVDDRKGRIKRYKHYSIRIEW